MVAPEGDRELALRRVLVHAVSELLRDLRQVSRVLSADIPSPYIVEDDPPPTRSGSKSPHDPAARHLYSQSPHSYLGYQPGPLEESDVGIRLVRGDARADGFGASKVNSPSEDLAAG